jgi:hypothetical protein
MCRSARLHPLGAQAEERSDEAADAVLGAVLGDTHQGADDATDGGGNIANYFFPITALSTFTAFR